MVEIESEVRQQQVMKSHIKLQYSNLFHTHEELSSLLITKSNARHDLKTLRLMTIQSQMN
ncbi:CLUMA_CG001519, isoform A [Clunio marinus]|uniref:CLUMA_CG001519, isoform A n=1 Tax=Clunio marinus TaxID=568069 RepID=A0A1J1HNB7_9DIPT|nr:CLUMA_CG001519, isoform A [Clunio marinus]